MSFDDFEFVEIGRTYRSEMLPCGVYVSGYTVHMQMRPKYPRPEWVDEMVGYDQPQLTTECNSYTAHTSGTER